LKIVKIEPANKVQSFFSERDAFSVMPVKHHFSYLSVH
jgi:hypothetical protein